MARCASIDILQEIKLDGELNKVESSESDSDIDISNGPDQDIRKGEDNNSSDSVEIINNEGDVSPVYPVLSLKCLHDDATNEENESSGNDSGCKIEFMDISDVPELFINSDEEEKEDKENDSSRNDAKSEVDFSNIKVVSVSSMSNNEENKESKVSTQKSPQEEEHPHLVPLINRNSKIPGPSYSSVPARNNWEGAHNFKIKIHCPPAASKKSGEHIIFEEAQNKLYVAKDYPFKVLISAENVPMDTMIRVTAVFSLVEHYNEVVQRCPTHAQQDFNKGVAYFEHFVQCLSDAAVYEKNHKTRKLSVYVLYKKPQEGETYSAYLFKLTCFSSCSGGINRRPFMLIFTLEKDNILLGRQTIGTKVCACPFRDYKRDKVSKYGFKSNRKESSSESDPDNIKSYSIAVKDPELYVFLEHMKTLYETSASQLISDFKNSDFSS